MKSISEAQTMNMRDLCQNIIQQHHDYIHQKGPQLLAQGRELHQQYPAVAPILNTLQDLIDDLTLHMAKEEAILFPLCQRLELAVENVNSHCGSVANPIQVMEADHEHCEGQLEILAILTHQFTPSLVNTSAYAEWLKGLKALYDNLVLHMEKENTLLFPKALEKEWVLQKN